MKHILYKLFLGKPEYNHAIKLSAYKSYKCNLKQIWDNEKHNDIGLEKVLRLFLVATQFIFPGLHVRNFFGKRGVIVRNVAVEFYVVFKTILPIIFLVTGLYLNLATVIISSYLLLETLCYVASLIFVSDIFVKPRSYRRNILMLSFNYVEISLSFAVVYAGLHLLGDAPQTIVDYIYFSIITSTTLGYGDFNPIGEVAKMIVCVHSVVVISFIVLFLNFFSSKVETMHHEDEQ